MINLADLLALGGRLHGPARAERFSDWSYDSRLTQPGQLFVALRTPRADGHDYSADALLAGAVGLLCSYPPADAGGATLILADDPLGLLQRWAAQHLRQVAPLVVAVTGSLGKTTSSRAISALLAAHGPTFSSRDSFNTALGLPVALARLSAGTRYAVLELASDYPCEIARLARLFPPQLAVITNVADVHSRAFVSGLSRTSVNGASDTPVNGLSRTSVNGLSGFSGITEISLPLSNPPTAAAAAPLNPLNPLTSTPLNPLSSLATEFAALLAALPPAGQAVLNGDDPLLAALADAQRHPTIRYGTGPGCDLRAEALRYTLEGVSFRLSWQGRSVEALVPLLGPPGLYAALAAMACGLACGMELAACVAALANVRPAPGRLRLLPGPGGAALIDDSADASQPAALAALQALAALPAQRRIAIVGELAGQPTSAARGYAELGELAGATLDLLIGLGDGPAQAVAAARAACVTASVATASAAIEALPADLGPGDLLLVSGGAAARLERLVAQLLPKMHHRGTESTEILIAEEDRSKTALKKPLRAPRLGDEITQKMHHRGTESTEILIAEETSNTTALKESLCPLRLGGEIQNLLVRQEPAWRSVRVGLPGRPTWLRLDLEALAQNVRQLCALAGVPLMVVLKADAYGHGAVRAARTALAAGAQALAVATLGEARVLRDSGLTAPILVLGYTPPWQAREAALLDLACTIFDDDSARALADAGADRGRPLAAHVKVDTGMARLGLPPAEVGPFLARLRHLPGLRVEGIYTHFATADSADERFARQQLALFSALLGEITAAGLRPPIAHAANSAAMLRFPEARLDMVRPGIACYGLRPGPETPLPPALRPVLALHSEIAQVREHPAGTPISYGGIYRTARPSRIATVPVGYGDGLRRTPPWRELLVRGKRAPIVGRICMDYLMVDVTHIPGVRRGDAVVLIGAQGDEQISADEVADWLGTISYEVVTGILPRVPREIEG